MSTRAHLAGVRLAGADPQPGLGGVEGDRDRRAHGLARDLAARGVDAARARRRSRPARRRALIASIASRHGAARLALEARAEQRVDDHAPPERSRPRPRALGAPGVLRAPTRRRRGAAAPRRAAARGSRARRRRTPAGGATQTTLTCAPGVAQQARDAPARRRRCCPCRRRPPRARRARSCSTARATPAPARSISSSPGTPCSLDRPAIDRRASSRRRAAASASRAASPRDGDARWSARSRPRARRRRDGRYSTVTVLARLRGWSTFRPAPARDLVGEQLQRDHGEHRLQHPVDRAAARSRRRRAARRARRPRVASAITCAPRARTSCMLEIDLLEHRRVGGDADHRRGLVEQRDRAVLHLAGGVGVGGDVGDLLELQRALERHGQADVAADVEEELALPAARRRSRATCAAASGRAPRRCSAAGA